MLVDRRLWKQSKADFVTWGHHDGVIPVRIVGGCRGASDQIRTLYCRSGGTSADYAAPCQQRLNFSFHGGSKIGTRQPPLATTLDPNARSTAQRLNEFFGIGRFAIPCVKHGYVADTEVPGETLPDFIRVDLSVLPR